MKKGMSLAVFAMISVLIAYSAGAQILSRVDPGRGQPGARVNVRGSNLDRCAMDGVLTIYFPGQNVYLDLTRWEWSSSNVAGYIPGLEATGWTPEQKQYFYNNATNGEVKIVTMEDSRRVDCARSSASTFKFIPPAPSFLMFGEGDFKVGGIFQIWGSGFGTRQGKVVYPKIVGTEIRDGEFPIMSWSENAISAKIPLDIPTGVWHEVMIRRDDGDGLYTTSNPINMIFYPLEIIPYRPELQRMPPRKIMPHPGGVEPVKPEL